MASSQQIYVVMLTTINIINKNSAAWRRIVMGPMYILLFSNNKDLCEVHIVRQVGLISHQLGLASQHQLGPKGTEICLWLMTFERWQVGRSYTIDYNGVSQPKQGPPNTVWTDPRSDRNSH